MRLAAGLIACFLLLATAAVAQDYGGDTGGSGGTTGTTSGDTSTTGGAGTTGDASTTTTGDTSGTTGTTGTTATGASPWFGPFTVSGNDVSGDWVRFQYDAATGILSSYAVKAGPSGTPVAPGATTPSGGAGGGTDASGTSGSGTTGSQGDTGGTTEPTTAGDGAGGTSGPMTGITATQVGFVNVWDQVRIDGFVPSAAPAGGLPFSASSVANMASYCGLGPAPSSTGAGAGGGASDANATTGTTGATGTTSGFNTPVGLFVLCGSDAVLMAHNEAKGVLQVVAVQPLTVSLLPAQGVTVGTSTATGTGASGSVLPVTGTGLDGRLVVVGPGTVDTTGGGSTGGTNDTSGTTGTAAGSSVTVNLQRGAQLVFLVRPQAALSPDFDSEVRGIQQGQLAGGAVVSGTGTTLQWHPADFGVAVAPASGASAAQAMSLRAIDHRAADGLCPAAPAATDGGTAPGGTEGTTGATVTGCEANYAVLLLLDLGSAADAANVQMTLDGQQLPRLGSLAAVLSASATGTTTGAAGAPQGGVTQPGEETTTESNTGQGTTVSGGPGGGTTDPPTAVSGIGFFAAMENNVLKVAALLPPGDHGLVVTSAAPQQPGAPATGQEETGQPRPSTPGFEAAAMLAALGAGALVLARRKRE